MNADQMKDFCRAAQMGIICGLDHRYEWYTNAWRSAQHLHYEQVTSYRDRLTAAFTAFERGLASCPEEAADLHSLSEDGFADLVVKWYEQGSPRNDPSR